MSGVSEISICNLSLAFLGEDSIRAFDEDNKRARLLQATYERARDYLLVQMDWSFARKYATLNQLGEDTVTVPDGYYAWQIPSDSVRPIDVDPLGSRETWGVQGNMVLTTFSPVNLYYTAQIDNTALFPHNFVTALASLIAWWVAHPITKDVKQKGEMNRQYLIHLAEAMTIEANTGNRYPEPDDDPNSDTFVDPSSVALGTSGDDNR
jgi:hypothetical protein